MSKTYSRIKIWSILQNGIYLFQIFNNRSNKTADEAIIEERVQDNQETLLHCEEFS